MAAIPATISISNLRFSSLRNGDFELKPFRRLNSCRLRRNWRSAIRLSVDSVESVDSCQDESISEGRRGSGLDPGKKTSSMPGMVVAMQPAVSWMKSNMDSKVALGICVMFAFMAVVMRKVISSSHGQYQHGSIADLVRRGQLKSDRRGISKPLRYDDPFNNPLVKISKNDSTVEVCGKVYRLAPVTLTKEEQSKHQKRRSRAYEWKRPKIFLKEGDAIPPNIDPGDVRWIPANHPFATTVMDIDEDLARQNVHQKCGVPFRVKAEHEALQRKLQQLQSEQKLDDEMVDESSFRDLEIPLSQDSSFSSSQHNDGVDIKPNRDSESSDSGNTSPAN